VLVPARGGDAADAGDAAVTVNLSQP
jgi:hypothetical protein